MNNIHWLAYGLLISCASEPTAEPAGPEDDVEIDYTWEQTEDGGCPDSWVLTYSLNGRIDITDTPLNIGNADALVGGLETDELVIRVADDGGKPQLGQVLLTDFHFLQDFRVSVNMLGEIAIITDLLSSSYDECGIASGTLDGSTISWDDCDFGPQHGTPSWGPEEGAYGAGCIKDYRVEGIVECVDDSWIASCSDGWLDEGENNLDYVYNQPMLDLEFTSSDLQSFTMKGNQYGMELPTSTNNRTWLVLHGERKSMSLEPTPDCLCNE